MSIVSLKATCVRYVGLENITMKCTNHVQGDSYLGWVPNIPWLNSQGPRLLSIVKGPMHYYIIIRGHTKGVLIATKWVTQYT